MKIRMADAGDISILAMLVSEANKDVAVKFGLNAQNCPKHLHSAPRPGLRAI